METTNSLIFLKVGNVKDRQTLLNFASWFHLTNHQTKTTIYVGRRRATCGPRVGQHCSRASDSTYHYTFLHRVVCPPLIYQICAVVLCVKWGLPLGQVDFGVKPRTKTCSCKMVNGNDKWFCILPNYFSACLFGVLLIWITVNINGHVGNLIAVWELPVKKLISLEKLLVVTSAQLYFCTVAYIMWEHRQECLKKWSKYMDMSGILILGIFHHNCGLYVNFAYSFTL